MGSDERMSLSDRLRVHLCLLSTLFMGMGAGMWLPARLPTMGLVWPVLGLLGWLVLVGWAVRDQRREARDG